jgi:uncharacterized protein YecA (UPF0149 family)
MQWALDHWGEAGPPLRAVLDRASRDEDAAFEASGQALMAAYLAAQARDGQAFAAICRMGMSPEVLEASLGESEDYARLLISTFDDDLRPLRSLIEAEGGDEFARSHALQALTWLAAHGRADRREAEAYLERLAEALPAEESFVWYGWQWAIAVLGLQRLAPLVQQAFAAERISPTIMNYGDFLEDLNSALAASGSERAFEKEQLAPIDDVIGELSNWYCYSEDYRRRRLADEQGGGLDEDEYWPLQEPAINPFRDVGRNDPCPCGSGKKFKKCCLAAA